MTKKVLSCGQCSFDHQAISALFKQLNASIEVSEAHSVGDALLAVGKQRYNLILINRIFDRTGEEGLTLIGDLNKKALTENVPLVLISNFPEAQLAAGQLGARAGFGKSQLRDGETSELLRQYLSL